MAEHKYVGKGKAHTFKEGNTVLNLGLRVADLVANERGYVNLTVAKLKEPDQWGNTHTVYLNEYTKPEDKDDAGF